MTLPGESIVEMLDDVLERFCKNFLKKDYEDLKKTLVNKVFCYGIMSLK